MTLARKTGRSLFTHRSLPKMFSKTCPSGPLFFKYLPGPASTAFVCLDRASETLVLTAYETSGLGQNLRDATSDGRDVDDVLRNIIAMKRTRSAASLRDDPAGAWTMREATFLLRFCVEQRMQRLNVLERVPPPPAFYR